MLPLQTAQQMLSPEAASDPDGTDAIVALLEAHRDEQTFHAFRVNDGSEPWIAPILYTGGLHNPPAPPCANPETGEVFVQLPVCLRPGRTLQTHLGRPAHGRAARFSDGRSRAAHHGRLFGRYRR